VGHIETYIRTVESYRQTDGQYARQISQFCTNGQSNRTSQFSLWFTRYS